MSPRLSLSLAVSLACACGPAPLPVLDAGPFDAGQRLDAGGEVDAGDEFDAGAELDAGVDAGEVDAGVVVPRGRIAGRVTWVGTGSFEGVIVLLSGPITAQSGTDSQGFYAFTELPDGAYRVRVEAPSGLGSETDVTIEDGAQAEAAALTLVQTGLAMGRVLLDGTPVAGADIASGTYGTTTSADGAFTLELPVGTHTIGASHPEAVSNVLAGGLVITWGGTTVVPDLVLSRPVALASGTLQGRVLNRAGAPVANVEVTIETLPGPPGRMTGPDGRFAFTGLAAGTHRIGAVRGGEGAGATGLVVGPGLAGIDVGDLVLEPAGSTDTGRITGRAQWAGLTQHAGITVKIGGAFTSVRTTGSSGAWSFEHLPDGAYTVEFGSEFAEASQTRTVVIEGGAAVVVPDVTLVPWGEVAGVAHGGALVFVPGLERAVTANEAGLYRLRVPAGERAVHAVANGFEEGVATSVTVAAGATTAVPALAMPAGTTPATVTGTAGAAGITVTAGAVTATTASDGTYTLALAAGRHTLAFSKPGFEAAELVDVVASSAQAARQHVSGRLTPLPAVTLVASINGLTWKCGDAIATTIDAAFACPSQTPTWLYTTNGQRVDVRPAAGVSRHSLWIEPGGDFVAVTSGNGARVLDAHDGHELGRFSTPGEGGSMSYTRDHRYFVLVSAEVIFALNLATGAVTNFPGAQAFEATAGNVLPYVDRSEPRASRVLRKRDLASGTDTILATIGAESAWNTTSTSYVLWTDKRVEVATGVISSFAPWTYATVTTNDLALVRRVTGGFTELGVLNPATGAVTALNGTFSNPSIYVDGNGTQGLLTITETTGSFGAPITTTRVVSLAPDGTPTTLFSQAIGGPQRPVSLVSPAGVQFFNLYPDAATPCPALQARVLSTGIVTTIASPPASCLEFLSGERVAFSGATSLSFATSEGVTDSITGLTTTSRPVSPRKTRVVYQRGGTWYGRRIATGQEKALALTDATLPSFSVIWLNERLMLRSTLSSAWSSETEAFRLFALP